MIRPLALLLATPAAAAWLAGVSVTQEAASATVAIAVAGTFGYTTRHWTGPLNTLVIDIHPAWLAAKPGTQHSSRHLRVRTGQFQQLTVRVVIESPEPFLWAVHRTPEGLKATIELPQLRPDLPARPAPGPTRPAATSSSQPSPQVPTPPTRIFAIHAAGTLHAVAQTIAAITATRIEVDPPVAHRHVVLNLPRTTLQQALAELARQTGARWTTLPDGAIRISL